jgi:hypothetical protein
MILIYLEGRITETEMDIAKAKEMVGWRVIENVNEVLLLSWFEILMF